jgi:hypothetical protein
VFAAAVQFSVPGPLFEISILPAGGALPPITALNVKPFFERTIRGSGVTVIVMGTIAY